MKFNQCVALSTVLCTRGSFIITVTKNTSTIMSILHHLYCTGTTTAFINYKRSCSSFAD